MPARTSTCSRRAWALSLALAAMLACASEQASAQWALAWYQLAKYGPRTTVKGRPRVKGSQSKNWFQREIVDRLNVSGYRNLAYHNQVVSGDTDAYDTTNYGGLGGQTFTDMGFVNVRGQQVLGALNFDLNFQDSRYSDPQSDHLSVDYQRGHWTANLGDIRGSLLNTNSLVAFSKTLRGAQFGYNSDKFRFKTLYSSVRGAPTTISLQGNNTAGPYYLQSSQIVRGTESIEVDGVAQQLGQDYVIDYESGSISFVNRQNLQSRIIPPTSTIVATYEALGYDGASGVVRGAGMSYDFGHLGRVGLTAVQQMVGGSGNLSTRLEKFQGYGPASTPYILQFEPLSGQPVVVRVDGVLQTQGVDYYFDSENPSIFYFTRFMASTSNIDVLYTPKPTKTVNGDRQNLGIDYSIPLKTKNSSGYINYAIATSKLTNTATPLDGYARSYGFRYQVGKAEMAMSYRDIPSDFVGIETAGFNRNERATTGSLTITPSSSLRYGVKGQNSSVQVQETASDGTVTYTPTRSTSLGGFLESTPSGKGLPISLDYTRTRGRTTTGDISTDTASLSTSRTFGRLRTRLALDDSTTEGAATLEDGTKVNHYHLFGTSLTASYDAGKKLTTQFDGSISAIDAEGTKGMGRDYSFSATYRPHDKFSASVGYTDSNAGDVAVSGLSTTYGLGYGGNGYSSGSTSSATTGVTNSRQTRLNLDYKPNARLSMILAASYARTTGSMSANSDTRAYSAIGDYELGRSNSVNAVLTTSDTSYVDSVVSSRASTFTLGLDGSPPGRWSYRLNFNALVSGGSSTYAQDSSGLEASLSYLLSPKHSLSLSYNRGLSSGYQPQDDADVALTYAYRIWHGLSLNCTYRIHDVRSRDSSVTSGAYSSRGFDIELGFNFGS